MRMRMVAVAAGLAYKPDWHRCLSDVDGRTHHLLHPPPFAPSLTFNIREGQRRPSAPAAAADRLPGEMFV